MTARPTVWWPLDKVQITGPWGVTRTGLAGHNGIDLGHNLIGTPVYAGDDGVIEFEGWGQNHSWMGAIAGISVLIRHSWGFTGYAHMNSTIVDRGQRVTRGQQIGTLGSTGGSTGPHVHFETLPLSPAFGNGYAGRVNPSTFVNLVARGGGAAPTSGDDMPRILNMRETNDGKSNNGKMFFDGGPGVGIKHIANPNHLSLLQRFLTDRSGDFMYPAELAIINTYLAPGTPTLSAATVEQAVTNAIRAAGGSVEAAQIAAAVESVLKDDFAAIPAATAKALGQKLS